MARIGDGHFTIDFSIPNEHSQSPFISSAQAHSWHKNLATLIRYDDRRQQLQGKAAKTLADAILKLEVD